MATETEFRSTSNGAETVIHRRDCVAGMRELLDPESVDVVVTSPPYNLGIAYRSYDDTVPRTEYLDWIAPWGDAVYRVLTRRSGSLFLNMPQPGVTRGVAPERCRRAPGLLDRKAGEDRSRATWGVVGSVRPALLRPGFSPA